MAEFCLECWNKLNGTDDDERKYVLSKEWDLCEGCGKWKPVIIMERKAYYIYKLRYFVIPFKIIYMIFYFIWRLLILPYLIYRYKKPKNKRNWKYIVAILNVKDTKKRTRLRSLLCVCPFEFSKKDILQNIF